MVVGLGINRVVRAIQVCPAPVLALDTCSLLDIARIPTSQRNSNNAGRLLGLVQHLASLAAPPVPRLHLITAELVRNEWTDNQSKELDRLREHLENVDRQLEVACAVAVKLGCAIDSVSLSALGLPSRLQSIQIRILRNAKTIRQYKRLENDAIGRAAAEIPPSRKGSFKDTLIYLHYIDLFKELRSAGFTRRCAFLSSNTNDFCGHGSRDPKPQILEELQPISVDYADNWFRAARVLGCISTGSSGQ